jgi:hypothetical protein
MYLVMFVMIDGWSGFYNNLNMLYMALMMVAPMVLLMILAMRHMFASRAAPGRNHRVPVASTKALQKVRGQSLSAAYGWVNAYNDG